MDKLPDLDRLSSEQKNSLILFLWDYVAKLEARIIELEAEVKELKSKLGKNSQNSDKPPSSDSYKKIQSKREKSGKKSGGQIHHPGHILKICTHPDRILEHKPITCANCGKDIQSTPCANRKVAQVFDIPELKIEVTEHQVIEKVCPCCGCHSSGKLPAGVNFGTQYGSNLSSLLVYLHHYHYISSKRITEFCYDVLGHSISEGVIFKAEKELYFRLSIFEDKLKEHLRKQKVAHADETSLRVNNRNTWLHVVSTNKLTFYSVHQKRGKKATDDIGILPFFKGTLVHDHWKAYFQYNCLHALCNAHHLRELTAVSEGTCHTWAKKMADLLNEINKNKDENKLDEMEIAAFNTQYDEILELGFKEANQIHATGPPKKKSHPKEVCFLDRLKNRKEQVLAFMYKMEVPFTNNLAERDIRMMKVKMKVSGCFRKDYGADYFCLIRSYISTMKKQGKAILSSIKQALCGEPCYAFSY